MLTRLCLLTLSVLALAACGDDDPHGPVPPPGPSFGEGRFVVFASNAANLVEGGTNGAGHVFVHDRQTGETTIESVSSQGTQSDTGGSHPVITPDGRFVAFESIAPNLVEGDTNGRSDVFVHDRETGETTSVSVSSTGAEIFPFAGSATPALSADGQFVAFISDAAGLVDGDTNGEIDIFIHDRNTGEITRVSVSSSGAQSNGDSFVPNLSKDARFVTFYSLASNLVDGDTNGVFDVFIHDRETGETTRVSVSSNGDQGDGASLGSAVSADGRFVAFQSQATNLIDGDTNGAQDIFVHDRDTGETTRVSVTSAGAQAGGGRVASISDDGRYVVFDSGDGTLAEPPLSTPQGHIYLHDREKRETTRVSVANSGAETNDYSIAASISRGGRFVAFESAATNLVANDMNGVPDIFIHDREAGDITRVNVASDGTEANGFSGSGNLSRNP